MEPSIILDILASLQRLFVGYIPAAVLGSFIGYLIGLNQMVYQVFRRIFQLPYSIPPVVLLPIALILIKENELATVSIIFLGTLWAVIVNTAIGMRHFYRQGRNFRAAIFHLFHALKVGILVAWFTVIATEMLISPRGLGFIIWDAYKASNLNDIIIAIFYIAIIGILLDQLLDFMGYVLAQIVSDSKKSK